MEVSGTKHGGLWTQTLSLIGDFGYTNDVDGAEDTEDAGYTVDAEHVTRKVWCGACRCQERHL